MTDESMKPEAAPARGSEPLYDDAYRDPPSARDHVLAMLAHPGCETVHAIERRILALEAALLPLAARAMVMKSIRMNDAARPRPTKGMRAGGTWIAGDDGPLCLYTEDEHAAALDAVGRERTRLYMAEQVQRQADRADAAEALKNLVECGKETH